MLKPTTLNAFYDPASNSMNIFPAYVTSLVYTKDMSDTNLLSGIGTTIGHEISHGFDYQGAQFDAYVTPNAVFTDEDLDVFWTSAIRWPSTTTESRYGPTRWQTVIT